MSDDRPDVPDVDRLARSMLLLHGDLHDHDEEPARADNSDGKADSGSWSKSKNFANDPKRAELVAEATQADRELYLTVGLMPVDCRFCHATVSVRKLGPGYTAVQWNTESSQRCAHFIEVRAAGENTARTRGCPRLSDSIEHAVAEGILKRQAVE